MTITNEMLDQLQAIVDNASPGPWQAVSNIDEAMRNWLLATGCGHDSNDWYVSTYRIHCSDMVTGGAEEDARFMAAARTAVPAMIAEIRAQQALLAAALDFIAHQVTTSDLSRHAPAELHAAVYEHLRAKEPK